jgi:hypothetical protein
MIITNPEIIKSIIIKLWVNPVNWLKRAFAFEVATQLFPNFVIWSKMKKRVKTAMKTATMPIASADNPFIHSLIWILI